MKKDKWIKTRGINGEYGYLNLSTNLFRTTLPNSREEEKLKLIKNNKLILKLQSANRAKFERFEAKRRNHSDETIKKQIKTPIMTMDNKGNFHNNYVKLLAPGEDSTGGSDPVGSFIVANVAVNPLFKAVGRAALYGLAKAGNNWARARIINREMQNISTPTEAFPNNVGWAPKLTILVSHARNRNEIPNLYFEKRWDVVNEGANPHGIWYQGKLGIPRTDLTNPGKGAKALKARDLFANRKYHLNGEVTFEKPMQTIGEVKNRSKLSYDADNMGADGLIYNDVYDNGYNHNLVILGWKLFNLPNIKLSVSSYDFFDESNPLNLSPISVKRFFKK